MTGGDYWVVVLLALLGVQALLTWSATRVVFHHIVQLRMQVLHLQAAAEALELELRAARARINITQMPTL